MDRQHRETCSECGKAFVRDDSIESLGGRLVHTRCLPKTPRFIDDEPEPGPEPAPDPSPA